MDNIPLSMMEQLLQKPKVFDGINWEDLTYDLDETDTSILKKIYLPTMKILAFESLFKLINLNRNRNLLSKTNLRNRLNKINKCNLVKLIRTKPLIINPIYNISEAKVKNLLKILSMKHELEKVE